MINDDTIKKTICRNIAKYRKVAGLSQKEFAQKLGAAPSRVSSWETGANSTDIDTLFQICEILNVSINDMCEVYPDANVLLSYLEQDHIKKYRTLDPTGQEHVDTVLKWEAERMEQFKQAKVPAAIIEFQSSPDGNNRMVEYFRSAAAFILGNEVAEQISIPNTPENRAVDFAIKVSGDSMFPDYADGDIVLVSQKAELFHGEVGIFIINNNVYIKEYGEKELISRNPEADNIEIAEYDNIVCMGKVIGKL